MAICVVVHYEQYDQIWLNDCRDEFKPVYYKRYVDDIFVLFRYPNIQYSNTKHANIKFTGEKEVNGSLPFLDVLISRNNKGFTTTVSLHLVGFTI